MLTSRQKNVHAYAVGTFTSAPQPTATRGPISYDPYRAGYFCRLCDPEAPVHQAAALLLDQGKVYATPAT